MLAIRNPDDAELIEHPHIKSLVIERFAMLNEYEQPYQPDAHGWFLVLTYADNPQVTSFGGLDLLVDDDGVVFGQAGFLAYEWCADHVDCYELVRVVDGIAVAIFIPKPVQHSDLYRLCVELSEPVLP